MVDLSYFNIGFRSDSVSNMLNEWKASKKFNDYLLKDASLIIEDCLKIEDDNIVVSNLSIGKGYEYHNLLPLIAEMYTGKSRDEALNELKLVYKTILKANQGNENMMVDEIDLAISFFSGLSALCIANSAHQSITDQFSLL